MAACPPKRRRGAKAETPGNQFPGGHRGRVTPVPIPNTEVKPATADGTACAGVWESRSLPGLFLRARFRNEAGSSLVRPARQRHRHSIRAGETLPDTEGDRVQQRHQGPTLVVLALQLMQGRP